jgi:uncharacterized protein (DUF2252 family)
VGAGRRGRASTTGRWSRYEPNVGPSRAARLRWGKELRRRLPRSRQGSWAARPDRPDPIDLLEEDDRGRRSDLLPIRYARMSSSPFAFYRGSGAVMANDLAAEPTSRIFVQMVGDAHLANFGFFGTPERDLVFDVNDFDETLEGPWEWDVKRLATSLVLVADELGFGRAAGRRAVRRTVRAYREHLRAFARSTYLATWYAHLDGRTASDIVGADAQRVLRAGLRRARRRTDFHAFPRLVRTQRGRASIVADPPLIRRLSASADRTVRETLAEYRRTLAPDRRGLFDRYRLVDVAEKVVGVGSVGTRCAVALLLGDEDVFDPLFLQVKEARSAAGERYLATSPFSNHAERVVVGQRSVQEASDIFLGWGASHGRDFYVRQLRDMKFASDLSSFTSRALDGQGELCAFALARAHARTGDAARIAGYLGGGEAFDRALEAFADRYARQVVADYQALKQAVRSGRLPAGG